MKALVAYFSASGVTAAVAKRLAGAVGASLYEIKPAVPYTTEDLDWRNQQSRSSVEMKDKACRPALADTDASVAEAEVIFLGYPVWWYREPSVIDTFLDAYSFKGKKIASSPPPAPAASARKRLPASPRSPERKCCPESGSPRTSLRRS